MPDADADHAASDTTPLPHGGRVADQEGAGEQITPATAPAPLPIAPKRRGPGPLGRLVSLIITVGLAWALTVAITAWLLGLFLTRG